jgi:hypothetical protein
MRLFRHVQQTPRHRFELTSSKCVFKISTFQQRETWVGTQRHQFAYHPHVRRHRSKHQTDLGDNEHLAVLITPSMPGHSNVVRPSDVQHDTAP